MNISEFCIRRPVFTIFADAGYCRRRHCRISDPGDQRAAAGRFSDYSGKRQSARRQPGDHGCIRGDAARTAILHHFRRQFDHVEQHAGQHADHACSLILIAISTARRLMCKRRLPRPPGGCRPRCRRRHRSRRSIPPTSRSFLSPYRRIRCRSRRLTNMRTRCWRSAFRCCRAWRRFRSMARRNTRCGSKPIPGFWRRAISRCPK